MRKWFAAAAVGIVMVAASPAAAQQQATVTGRVTDAQGRAAAGALVRIPSLGVGTRAGEDGTYRLVVPGSRVGNGVAAGIEATRTGLRTQARSIRLAPGMASTVNFQLAAAVLDLDEVVVD